MEEAKTRLLPASAVDDTNQDGETRDRDDSHVVSRSPGGSVAFKDDLQRVAKDPNEEMEEAKARLLPASAVDDTNQDGETRDQDDSHVVSRSPGGSEGFKDDFQRVAKDPNEEIEEAKARLLPASAVDDTNQDGETRDQDDSHVVSRSPRGSEGFKDDLQRVAKDLNELGELRGPGFGSSSSSGSSQDFVEPGSPRPHGPLRFYHRGTAVRMLKDYLSDLKTLNLMTISLDGDLQSRVKDYEIFYADLKKANTREPNSPLTWQERGKLSTMLKDYQIALSVYLEDQEEQDVPGVDDVEYIVENEYADGVPLHLHEAEFSGGAYVESLTAALDRCATQAKEFMNDLVPIVFLNQCKHVVDTLGPIAVNNFKRYRSALGALQKLEVDGGGVSSSSRLRNCVHFCFESLIGLARKLQLVVDLFRKCATTAENLHRTALGLADLPPPPTMYRWSEFSLVIRNCEWSMDLVDLAFYTLEKLLSGSTNIFEDVSFKWSEGRGRMVLQIQGKLGRQDSRLEKPFLDLMKELEVNDLQDLVQELQKLASEVGNDSKWSLTKFLTKVDANRTSMADFLSKKLSGPIPHAKILPWSFRVDHHTLKFREYMDSGSSGMVAKYTWFGEEVAVKSVRSPGLSRHRFEEEAAILATVQHPNVVRLIGCGFIEEKKIGMLVMELMHHDLRTVIDSRVKELGVGSSPFSTIVAIDIILQIAQAMRHLWEHKVLHRDLKAKNVLVNIYKFGGASNTNLMRRPDVSTVLPHTQENYVSKLADFGLAKCRPQSSWVATRMAGTTGWRAPEVFNVQDTEVTQLYKWPADVYSFAMTCYEILTGKVPFEECTNSSIHENVMAGRRPQGLDELEIPDLLKDLVKKCWATIPDERPTFEEIVKSLWECRVKAILPVFERHITTGVLRSASSAGTSTAVSRSSSSAGLKGV